VDAVLYPGLSPSRHAHVRRFLASYPGVARRFEECSDAAGYDLEEAYSTALIDDWEPYQLAFLAINLSLVEWMREERGIDPDVVCGQSFGGFVAAVGSGAVGLADMVRLLVSSGEVERRWFADQGRDLACVFFTRVDDAVVEALLADPAPGGWTELSVRHDGGVLAVSGDRRSVRRLEERVRAAGGRVFYVIDRAEHCPRMGPLRELLAEEVYGTVPFRAPVRRLVSDIDGSELSTGEDVARHLLDGWTHPVVAGDLYRGLLALDVDRLVVPGPRSAFRGHGAGAFELLPVSPGDVSTDLLTAQP